MLGKWTGKVEVVTTGENGDTPVAYSKTAECRISEAGDSFLMIDTEINPWTNEKVTTTAVIRFDRSSNTFKAMVSGSDGSVRLFVIRVSENALKWDLVDRPGDVNFKSKVAFKEDGTIREEGARSGRRPIPYAVKWKVTYTRRTD